MEVWFNQWRIGDDGLTFTVGDQIAMDVMPFERHDALVAQVGAAAADGIRHEVFDSDDVDPFLTVRGAIGGLREFRAWRSPEDRHVTDRCELRAVDSTEGEYRRTTRHGGDVEAYVLRITEDEPVSDEQIAKLAAAYVLVNARQERWQALTAAGKPWPADPFASEFTIG